MRRILSEKNVVVLLFVMALIVFSLAHRETKKMEMMYFVKGTAYSTIFSAPAQPQADLETLSLPALSK